MLLRLVHSGEMLIEVAYQYKMTDALTIGICRLLRAIAIKDWRIKMRMRINQGEQEAKAFVKLGFKLGVTGQITNPNAKKLRRAIQVAVEHYGSECLVIETDCPDMTPIMCQAPDNGSSPCGHYSMTGTATDSLATEWQDAYKHGRNVPANLPWVLSSLSELLDIPHDKLAQQLWRNSCDALQVKWNYRV